MASGSRSLRDVVLPRWIRPLRSCWKPLVWLWGAIFLGGFLQHQMFKNDDTECFMSDLTKSHGMSSRTEKMVMLHDSSSLA